MEGKGDIVSDSHGGLSSCLSKTILFSRYVFPTFKYCVDAFKKIFYYVLVMCNFWILISRYRCSNKETVNLPGSIACLQIPLSNKIILFLKHTALAILRQNYISIKIMFAQCFHVKENLALLIRTTIYFYLIHLPLD